MKLYEEAKQNTPVQDRVIDDYQPRTQLRKSYANGEITSGDPETVEAFSISTLSRRIMSFLFVVITLDLEWLNLKTSLLLKRNGPIKWIEDNAY